MGGENSPMFEYFKSLLIRGLFEVRKHLDELLVLIQIMAAMPPPTRSCSPSSEMPFVLDQNSASAMQQTTYRATVDVSMQCVKNMATLEQEIRDRVSGKFNSGVCKGNEFAEIVERIVNQSLNNNTTKLYDFFQKNTNGIEP